MDDMNFYVDNYSGDDEVILSVDELPVAKKLGITEVRLEPRSEEEFFTEESSEEEPSTVEEPVEEVAATEEVAEEVATAPAEEVATPAAEEVATPAAEEVATPAAEEVATPATAPAPAEEPVPEITEEPVAPTEVAPAQPNQQQMTGGRSRRQVSFFDLFPKKVTHRRRYRSRKTQRKNCRARRKVTRKY